MEIEENIKFKIIFWRAYAKLNKARFTRIKFVSASVVTV
jgi:hypothetical protein